MHRLLLLLASADALRQADPRNYQPTIYADATVDVMADAASNIKVAARHPDNIGTISCRTLGGAACAMEAQARGRPGGALVFMTATADCVGTNQCPGKPGIWGFLAFGVSSGTSNRQEKRTSDAILSKNGQNMTENPRSQRAFPNTGTNGLWHFLNRCVSTAYAAWGGSGRAALAWVEGPRPRRTGRPPPARPLGRGPSEAPPRRAAGRDPSLDARRGSPSREHLLGTRARRRRAGGGPSRSSATSPPVSRKSRDFGAFWCTRCLPGRQMV